MTRTLTLTLVVLTLLLTSLVARAAPHRYQLDPTDSSVSFTYTLLGERARGSMPVSEADLSLDFAQAANSRIRVTLDVTGAKTPVAFVTDAVKGPELLHAAVHPTIRFVSTRIVPTDAGARVSGNVTIRGVTRPLTLDARIYRRRGSAEGDLSALTVLMTGTVSRSSFGASGFPSMVADPIQLDIRAALRRID